MTDEVSAASPWEMHEGDANIDPRATADSNLLQPSHSLVDITEKPYFKTVFGKQQSGNTSFVHQD